MRRPAAEEHRPHVLPLSAATPTALAATAARLADRLRTDPGARIDEVAHTLQRGRRALPHRRFVVADTLDAAIDALARPPAARQTAHEPTTDRGVVFAFAGQGTQRIHMGQALYAREPAYATALDQVAEFLEPALGMDIRRLLHPAVGDDPTARETINRTEYAQPALFAVEYALAKLWMSWGIRPVAMLGHSIGELVAASLAGVLTLPDALRLVVARGRLMQSADEGTMVAVPLPEAEVGPLLRRGLTLAAVNGPRDCVVSGPADAVAALETVLAGRGVLSKRLRTSRAFHSPMMDGAAAAFEVEVARVPLAPPRIPFVSNVTGTWITDEEAGSAEYWARQLRSTVRFADGLRTVRTLDALLLEIGPGQVLSRFARAGEDGAGAVASLPSPAGDGDDATAWVDLLTAAGELWSRGAPIDWAALHGAATPLRTVLPTYPFERERCWVDPPRGTASRTGGEGLAVRGFRRVGPVVPRPDTPSGRWLVVGTLDAVGALDVLGDLAERRGTQVVPPPADGDYASLLASALTTEDRLAGVVHEAAAPAALHALEAALDARGQEAARILAVCDHAVDLTGDEPVEPHQAALTAWAADRPGRRTLLDVPAAATRRLAAALHAELDGVPGEPVVALRGGHRFVPSLEPLRPSTDAGRHAGTHYTLAGDERVAAMFHRALTAAGATVSHAPLSEATLVVLDAAGPEPRAHDVPAGELHIVGDVHLDATRSAVAALVEAQAARRGSESDRSWTTVVWPAADHATVERLVPSVVGAAPGAGRLVVLPPQLDGSAAEVAESAPESGGTPYEGDTEPEVAAIFADLLGIANIPPDTNFFELGGHSLLAAQLVAQLGKAAGVTLPLRTFVGDPTIRGVALAVDAARAGTGELLAEELPTIVPDPGSADLPFPLTDVQEAYWIGRAGVFELGNVGMHGYEEIDIPDLDLPRLERAFRTLIRRHGMLRAIVLPHGEQQILRDVPDYVIATEDVRGLTVDEADGVLERTRAAMSHQVFAPDRWPLFELRATVLGNRTRLHYSMDGLITDAWASHIVMRELVRLYRHPDTPLPDLDLSFRDYVLAERALASTEVHRRAANYWQERVPDLAPAPELPLARDPRTIDDPRFRRTAGTLPAQPWTRLKTWASRRGITPTVLLLTVYGDVLATWAKNRRFTLNLPMANRLPLHPQVDKIIGDFTSVTLLEFDAASEIPFADRAAAVRDRLANDLDHRSFSGVQVQKEIKRVRGEAAATMPVIFTSLFLDDGDDAHLGEVVYSISQTPQVWLDAQVYEVDGALALDIDAVEGLFPDDLVEAMHAATLKLLDRLAEDEANWDRPVPSLVPAADLAGREAYNLTSGPLPRGLLHEPIFATAARTPERPALITPHRTMTYGELATRAYGVAARLGHLDLRPNELVAVVMEKGWEQCVAVLGILAAGAAYLPIDPELPDERIRFLLDHGQVRAVLTQSRVAGASRFGDRDTVLHVDELPVDDAVEAPPAGDVTPGDLAYVIFTSGSTGLPKGVMIDHRGALNTCVDINERFGVGAEDRVLSLSSLSFDLSVYDIFGPLAVGGAVVLPAAGTHRDPAAWLDLVTTAGVTVWNSVPALMELLVEHLERERGLRRGAAARAAERGLDPGHAARPHPADARLPRGRQPGRRNRGVDLVDPLSDRRGAGAVAEHPVRPADAEPDLPRPRRGAAPPPDGCPGRALHRRYRPRPGLLARPGEDRRELLRAPGDRRAALPHGRPRPRTCRAGTSSSSAGRTSRSRCGLPHRAWRDRGDAAGAPGRAGGGRRGPGRAAGSQAARRVRRPAGRRRAAGRPARVPRHEAARVHGARRVPATGCLAAHRERQGRPARAGGARGPRRRHRGAVRGAEDAGRGGRRRGLGEHARRRFRRRPRQLLPPRWRLAHGDARGGPPPQGARRRGTGPRPVRQPDAGRHRARDRGPASRRARGHVRRTSPGTAVQLRHTDQPTEKST